MANVTHSTRTDPDLHEPKGIAEASAGTVYMADGAGSGSFARPLVLISSGNINSVAETEIDSLSDYSELIFIVEDGSIPEGSRLNLQVYGDTTAGYLTASTDYDHTYIADDDDRDEDDESVSGLMVVRSRSSSRIYLQSITRISNFNIAGQRTRSVSWSTAVNKYHPSDAATPTAGKPAVWHSQTAAAEVHSKLKVRLAGGGTVTLLNYSLWGIR